MNDSFVKTKIPEEITVEDDFPETRIRRKKRMFDEMCNDEAPTDPKLKFKIEVIQSIFDQLQTSLNDKFVNNKCIIADIQYLLPKYYNDVKNKLIPESVLNQLSILSSVNRSKLIDELKHFAIIHSQLVEPLCKKTSHMYNTSNEDNDFIQNDIDYEDLNLEWDCEISKTKFEHNTNVIHNRDNCLLYVYKLLHSLNLHLSTYSNLCATIEYVLTLSISQVNCERVFSKLKIIKNRLRALILNNHLEAFILMSVEKEILDQISLEDIIEYLKFSSSHMSKLLS
ncbi:uncharacterized protein LOC113547970 [Rhopalosiphum maidis]|uniref:uncharacterized protein LOC113547970 n=1 Tax=Rhopalosiphum maidis TaxID=43146 RepID=UPI000EFEE170|nr:uncharacterized protein LOC113547970 [Rhopalosiphum maidis]